MVGASAFTIAPNDFIRLPHRSGAAVFPAMMPPAGGSPVRLADLLFRRSKRPPYCDAAKPAAKESPKRSVNPTVDTDTWARKRATGKGAVRCRAGVDHCVLPGLLWQRLQDVLQYFTRNSAGGPPRSAMALEARHSAFMHHLSPSMPPTIRKQCWLENTLMLARNGRLRC